MGERWRIVNMLAMSIVQWGTVFGFNFFLSTQSHPRHPAKIMIWSEYLPEIDLRLHVTPNNVVLHVVSKKELRRIELEPCLISAYFTELKQLERQRAIAKQVDLSADAFDAKVTHNHGTSKN